VWLVQWLKSRSERNEFGVPIPNFARVTDTIYRGALPDREGYRGLADKLGVLRVCSIIEHESREDRERALAAGIEEWHHIAFSDRDAPQALQVRIWLDYIRTAETQGAIFTHCRGGRHRTGMLVGVYRVTDCGLDERAGVQRNAALRMVQRARPPTASHLVFRRIQPAGLRSKGSGER
jgi:hypothetical protein